MPLSKFCLAEFAIALNFICLLCFLSFSTSVITSIGAPVAFTVAFITMYFLGMSLNLISMFGLILVLGMLVDDSIIVSEHFYQKLENGMDPHKSPVHLPGHTRLRVQQSEKEAAFQRCGAAPVTARSIPGHPRLPIPGRWPWYRRGWF